MLTAYPACFFKEKKGYTIIFPDLNYFSTYAKSIDEALKVSPDYLAHYLYSCKIKKEKIPKATDINKINTKSIAQKLDLVYESAFVNIVTVDFKKYAKTHFEKSVKKTLTIPYWLNNMALEKNINFSQVLQEALKQHLNLSKRGEQN